MNKFFLFFALLIFLACGKTDVDVTTGADQSVVVTEKDQDIKTEHNPCNRVSYNELQLMRVRQLILYKNDGKQTVTVDVAGQTSGNSPIIISYKIEPLSKGQYMLPFVNGDILGPLYFSFNQSEWQEVCPEVEKNR